MKSLLIAQIAHLVNASYSLALGEDSHKPWAELGEEVQNSQIAGVEFRLANPDAPPSAQHEEWVKQKTADGWIYGETKDVDNKIHPCLVEFDQLPAELQAKDVLFTNLVKGLAAIPDEVPEPAPVVTSPVTRQAAPTGLALNNLTAVKYIGVRDFYVDGAYGTRIEFRKGETKLVPSDKAFLMLRHKDVYAKGDDVGAEVAVVIPGKEDENTEEELQTARDLVSNMGLEALKNYAFGNYGQKLHPAIGEAKARLQVANMIEQYGLPK
jgi:hypothetical protein